MKFTYSLSIREFRVSNLGFKPKTQLVQVEDSTISVCPVGCDFFIFIFCVVMIEKKTYGVALGWLNGFACVYVCLVLVFLDLRG